MGRITGLPWRPTDLREGLVPDLCLFLTTLGCWHEVALKDGPVWQFSHCPKEPQLVTEVPPGPCK